MDIRKFRANELNPAEYNPRKNLKPGDKEYEKIKASIERFGFVEPLVVNVRGGLNRIVGGHQRYKVLVELGVVDIDCVVMDCDEQTEKACNIALNKISGEWDEAALADLLRELNTGAFDMELVGFDNDELQKLMDWTPDSGGVVAEDDFDADAEAEAIAEPTTKRGDIWLLGKHRVMCGDSTSAADVEKLMAGSKVDLCFTSPPYSQQRDYTEESSELLQDWDSLMCGVFGNLPMSENAQVLVNLGLIHRDCEWVPYWNKWIDWMKTRGWRRFGWYVWDQCAGLMGNWNGRLAPSHEWIFHFNKNAVQPKKWVETKESSRKQKNVGAPGQRAKDGTVKKIYSPELYGGDWKIPDSVIRISRNATIDMARNNHPATFPIQFPAFILNSWNSDVYDPFLGSGTTLIAAEQLNRICYGMEISPIYCDVIVKRWEQLTGKKAVLEVDNGH